MLDELETSRHYLLVLGTFRRGSAHQHHFGRCHGIVSDHKSILRFAKVDRLDGRVHFWRSVADQRWHGFRVDVGVRSLLLTQLFRLAICFCFGCWIAWVLALDFYHDAGYMAQLTR